MENSSANDFDFHRVIHDIQHYLPAQTTLKDFIHHNSLHAFQSMRFYDGIFRASKIFGFKVTLQLEEYRMLYRAGRIKENVIDRVVMDRKGEEWVKEWVEKMLYGEFEQNIHARVGVLRSHWKEKVKLDVDSLVHPTLYRLLGAYLDQGIGNWMFPLQSNDGFLASIRALESESKFSFFQTKEGKKRLLNRSLTATDLLKRIVGDESYFESYLYDLCFAHRGWSGLVSTLEQNPEALFVKRPILLEEIIYVELLLEWDRLDKQLGNTWLPLSSLIDAPPENYLVETPKTMLDDVLSLWQDAFEWSYYDQVIQAIKRKPISRSTDAMSTSFQAIFCIDERECSFRRHLESVVPRAETYGAPGFFGVEFYYLADGAKYKEKLCPVPVMPKHLIKEIVGGCSHKKDTLFDTKSYSPILGLVQSFAKAPMAVARMLQWGFGTPLSLANSNSFSQVAEHARLTVEYVPGTPNEDGLQVGFTTEEMANRVEVFLKNIGLANNFAPLVYVVGHGSSTTNNPYYRAYDCGACSGRPGAVNSRVFAAMANHPLVRELLESRGLNIPNDTLFVPCLHDTTADEIRFYDVDRLSGKQLEWHKLHVESFEQALNLNGKERSRRLAAIDTRQSLPAIRKALRFRANAFAEPRPELGHGTNSLAIIGRRELTRGLFLDRRAFLNSYDYRTDPQGINLVRVMAPIGLVCGGINMEYYFSRVDNLKLGSGTKLAHSVNGLLGVCNSVDGDLRPGLPWQMIEPHDPIRLLVVVEHHPHIVLEAIKANNDVYEWYKNEWIHLVALDPESNEVFYFKDERFVHHQTDVMDVKLVRDIHDLFEKAPEMMTPHIAHATFENLPIYQLESFSN